MARNFSSTSTTDETADEEDYIDIEVSSSSSTIFCYSISSQHPREFEFQMSTKSLERDSTTSPADELFYKGKLLPLHLPPRLQMVEKLLHSSTSSNYDKKSESLLLPFEEDNFMTPLTTTNTTPFESCNISPAESCRVSRELNPDEYFLECSNEMSSFIDDNPKRSWSKKLKLIKKSSLGSKLKASSSYLKSLFSKSGCSDDSCAEAANARHERAISKTKECLNKYIKVGRKNPFGQIHRGRDQMEVTAIRGTAEKEKFVEDSGSSHRRSFSGAIKRHSPTKSSSSFSSSGSSSSLLSTTSSNGFYEPHLLKRSNSANSEIETSIQGAIAHCKQSQQMFCSRKNVSEGGFCSLSASKIAACEDQQRPQICRG